MNRNKTIVCAAALVLAGGSLKTIADGCWVEDMTPCSTSITAGCVNLSGGGSGSRSDVHVYSYATGLKDGADTGWDSPDDFDWETSSLPCVSFKFKLFSGSDCTGDVQATGSGTVNENIGRYTADTDAQCGAG